MRPARAAAAGTVPAIQIETGTRGSGLTLTPSSVEVLAAERDALAGEQRAHDRDQLLEPARAARHRDPERLERLRAAAVRERHDQRRARERGERADLLGEQDRVVERREQHHAERHARRSRAISRATVGIGANEFAKAAGTAWLSP